MAQVPDFPIVQERDTAQLLTKPPSAVLIFSLPRLRLLLAESKPIGVYAAGWRSRSGVGFPAALVGCWEGGSMARGLEMRGLKENKVISKSGSDALKKAGNPQKKTSRSYFRADASVSAGPVVVS